MITRLLLPLLVTLSSACSAAPNAQPPEPTPVIRIAPTATAVPTLEFPGLAPRSTEPPSRAEAPVATGAPSAAGVPSAAEPFGGEASDLDASLDGYDPARPLNLQAESAVPAGSLLLPAVSLAVRPADMAATARAARVPILMYHYLSAPPAGADRIRQDLSVSPQSFETQLKWLKENGYSTISLSDLHAHLSTGAPLPAKPIILTFDDGYRDNYVNAFPLLRKYGFTATFFLVSDFIHSGNPAYMTWPMVREMSDAGMSIESHSRTHPDMRNRTYEKLVWEILGPIESIEAVTGKRPRFFCYPAGRYDAAVVRVLRSAGVLAAVTTQPGKTHALGDAMTWTRVRIHGNTSLEGFANLVSQ